MLWVIPICTKPPAPTSTSPSIAPRASLRNPDLILLDHPLRILCKLAFLVAVSLILFSSGSAFLARAEYLIGYSSYLAFPRHEILFPPASVQRYEEMRAAISVGERETCFGHCFSGGRSRRSCIRRGIVS